MLGPRAGWRDWWRASTRARLGLWIFGWLGALLFGCSWEPVARDAKPEQLLAGPARLLRLIDGQGQHSLIQLGEGASQRYRIFHLESRSSCELPEGASIPSFLAPHYAPNLRGELAEPFLMPLFKRDGEQLNLYYTDQDCALRGPFGPTRDDDMGVLELRSDKRNVSLVRTVDDSMRLVDPWTGQTVFIAAHVTAYAPVQRTDSSTAPEALWLLENGQLTQRALDGTLLLSLGSEVTFFRQTLRDALRVAYRDNGDLYEAKGPDFTPVLISEDACNPIYDETSLNLWAPCSERQLVRIDLSTGAIRRFEPGVYRQYTAGEISFEQAHDDPDDPRATRVWVTVGAMGGTRHLLQPTPESALSVLGRQRIVGRAIDGQFGIWTIGSGFVAGYRDVALVQTFRDQRTTRLLWLMLRHVDEDAIGQLVVVDQEQLERVVADNEQYAGDAGIWDGDSGYLSPSASPLVIAEEVRAGGYQVFYPAAVRQPLIVSIGPPVVELNLEDEDPSNDSFSGTLLAHLLDGDQSTRIDEGVETYAVVLSPIPGILYGILQGPRSGLWFAAL